LTGISVLSKEMKNNKIKKGVIMEARTRRIVRKLAALGLAFNVGLSAWGTPAFAQNGSTERQNQNQIQSAEEFVPYSELKLENRKTLLMDDWKFHLGDTEGAQDAAFDDSAWKLVDLPHDYSITQDYSKSGEAESAFLLGGIGWYRKSLSFPEASKDKKVFINFDGVYMNAEVYLNGKKLGSHPYGYTAFSFELTPHIVWGGQNVLAVKVNNNVPTSRWYSGSGIYREVSLTAVNSIYVEKDGVYVTTPDIETNQANPTVMVSAELHSQLAEDAEITVTQTVYEKGGQTALASAGETEAGTVLTARMPCRCSLAASG